MAYGKWIGGWLGWMNSQSVLGALAGFALGAVFDAFTDRKTKPETDYVQQEPVMSTNDGERNSFLFSLMVLSAHIIQADGKIMHSEMELVRQFLRQSFGESSVEQGNSILLKLFEYRKKNGESVWQLQIQEACREMSKHMQEEYRLQLVAFLCEIAKVDGDIDKSEIEALHIVAANLALDTNVIEQMLHLGGKEVDDAYAVLGVSKDATDDEVRKAYRKMAIQYHPDRVATLGDDVKEAATKKFQELNNAKEIIFKARNLK